MSAAVCLKCNLEACVAEAVQASGNMGKSRNDSQAPLNPSPVVAAGAGFPTTRWTLVVAAGDETGPEHRVALESLCAGYWYPIYVFARRRGHPPDQAQDLTQSFFLQILSGGFFERASSEKGRFRSFLLGALKRFLADSKDHDMARKRGGGIAPLPFDFENGESNYLREPRDHETPERIFERRWARAVLDRAVFNLQNEFLAHGKPEQFQRLKLYLTGSGEVSYAQLAETLGMTLPAVKSAIQRLRVRYRQLLRAEVASTVADPLEVDEELRFLVRALSTQEGGGR